MVIIVKNTLIPKIEIVRNFFRLLIFIFLSISLVQSVFAQRSLQALRTDKPIKIDGKLDEPSWEAAAEATKFIQKRPEPGAPPSQKTIVRVLYNDIYLYVGAWMYDLNPEGILRELSGRDQGGNADRFSVYFDTYNDGLNAFEFTVTAAGEQLDSRISPGNYDRNWDAGWFSEVNLNEEGWCVEIEIPLSVLRFPQADIQTWGLNFGRVIKRENENVYWDEIDPKISGFVNQFGKLDGMNGIRTPLRLSITPYVSAYVNRHSSPSEGYNVTSTNIRGGLDIKYGINDAFTLDMMLIPDFGQVVSDNSILNLGPYEVYNQERRQFFMESTELFEKAGVFYSRRIGGKPIDHNFVDEKLIEGEEVMKNPVESRIINAAKISGRSRSGLGIGILNSITNKTFAIVRNNDGTERRIQTAPYINYNVLVLDQSLKNNSFVSFTNTNVSRSQGYYDANVTGANFKLSNKSNNYAIRGKAIVSHLYGFEEGGNDTGFHTNLWLGRTSGNFLYSINHRLESDRYNPNDLGFIRSPNDHNTSLNFKYLEYDPFFAFLNFSAEFNINYYRLYNPSIFTGAELESSIRATFKNYFTTRVWYDSSPFERKDFDETRTPGRFIYIPIYHNTGIYLNTDSRKRFRVSGWLHYSQTTTEKRNAIAFNLSPRMRINNQVSITTSLTGSNQRNNVGYVATVDEDINFGIRDIKSITNILTTKYSFNKDMDIFFRMRHYWSSAKYNEFQKLDSEGRLHPTGYYSDHDVNYNSFNIDMIYKWIFSPASEFSIAWKSSVLNSDNIIDINYVDNFMNTFEAPRDNSVSFKILYYLDYMMIKRNRESS